MLLYLFKRLLLIVPTLWLVGTVIFVLSRLMPGNYAATFISDESVYNPNINDGSQRRAYEQYVKKSGLDQPLFYVSLHTLAEPDTLYKVWQANEQDFFKRLIFRYGNWPYIVAYYNQLQQLQKAGQQAITDAADKKYFQNRMEIFFAGTEEKKIQQNFDALYWLAANIYTTPILTAHLDKTKQAYQTVQRESTLYKNLIPVLHWHGFHNQYHQWFIQLLHGDLGTSYRNARPVTAVIIQAINNTLLLSVCTLFFIFVLAFLINIFIGNEDFKWWRSPVLNFLFVIDTVPTFLMALFLLIFLAGTDFMQLFPVYGLGEMPQDASWFRQLFIRLHHLVIPVICLTATNLAYVSSQIYHAMREVQRMDYITTARAKGLPETVVVSKHVLRIASLPAITLFTGFLPALIGGALVIEVIFAIPGTGRLLVEAVLARDYPVILGIVLIIAFVKIIAHILADLLYYLADPGLGFDMAVKLSSKHISTLFSNWAFILSAGYVLLWLLCAFAAEWLPLPFLPEEQDLNNRFQAPFQLEKHIPGSPFHWLGTDQLGRDLLANLIYGCRTAVLVSFPAMFIATKIGILLGGIAGFYGDNTLRISVTAIILLPVFFLLAFFYSFYIWQMPLSEAFQENGVKGFALLFMCLLVFISIMAVAYSIELFLKKYTPYRRSVFLPADQLVLKCIEVLSAIPRIILILCLAAYTKPSVLNLILITGFTYWTEPARLIRAEFLRIKALNYIESARALGLQHFYILIKHALPNAWSSIMVAFTFGVVSLISLESTLSFLGIGLSPDVPSWGRIVVGAKTNISAWWLVVFPGAILSITVLALQTVSSYCIKYLDPRNR